MRTAYGVRKARRASETDTRRVVLGAQASTRDERRAGAKQSIVGDVDYVGKEEAMERERKICEGVSINTAGVLGKNGLTCSAGQSGIQDLLVSSRKFPVAQHQRSPPLF